MSAKIRTAAPTQDRGRDDAREASPLAAPRAVMRTLQEPGVPLPSATQAALGASAQNLGVDLRAVRVHADADAAASARSIGARAYALRPHVVFAPGMYRPESASGRSLLLHELGHHRQQAPLQTGAPILVDLGRGHEANADALARGGAGSPRSMAANVIARDADPAATGLVAGQTGRLDNGAFYTVRADGDLEVRFPPSARGFVIVADHDSAAIDLPPTGESAVQREGKRLTAYDTPVTAVYQAKHVVRGPDGAPKSLSALKPIAINANTFTSGVLVQEEFNRTTVGKGVTDVDDPAARLQKDIRKVKEIRGEYDLSKGPKELDGGQRTFKKYEESTIRGTAVEVEEAVTEDRSTGRTSRATKVARTEGAATGGRGRSEQGDYVLASEAKGPVRGAQESSKVQSYDLASGRTLVVAQEDNKRTLHTRSKKQLRNPGLEFQALHQEEDKDRSGAEFTDKVTRSQVLSAKQGRKGGPAVIARSYSRARGFSIGSGVGRAEDTVVDANDPQAAKVERTPLRGASGTLVTSADRAAGIGSYGVAGTLQAGKSVTRKKSQGPEVPSSGAKPPQGQVDLVNVAKELGSFKKGKAQGSASAGLAVTDAGVQGKVEGDLSYGLNTFKKEPEHSSLFGIFCVDTIRSGTDLAGVAARGGVTGQIQRGGRDAALRGGQASVAANASVQVGFLRERAIQFKVRPDAAKIPWPAVRAVVTAIDPLFDLTLKGHAFAGLELKGDASASAGKDSGVAAGAGGSAFLGLRGGFDIDGSIQIGRAIGADKGSVLGGVKGSFAATIGASASWKYAFSKVGGKVSVASEGGFALPLGAQGGIKVDFDLWKLGTAGLSVVRQIPAVKKAEEAITAYYRRDEDARAQVAAGAHTRMGLGERVALLGALLRGYVGEADQAAIVVVLADAKARGDLSELIKLVGRWRLALSLTGDRDTRYHQLADRP